MSTGYDDFDIRDPRFVTDGNKPKHPMTYRMINVMCFLMGGLTYSRYFNGYAKETVLPHLLHRLEANDYASKKHFVNHNGITLKTIPQKLHEKISTIKNDANIPSHLPMRALYQDKRGPEVPNSPEGRPVAKDEPSYYLWQHFAKLRADDRKNGKFAVFQHLCMPFLYQTEAIPPEVIDLFLYGDHDPTIPVIRKFHGLGRFELVDLYLKTKRELAETLLEDMYQEARQTVPQTPPGDFLNDDMRTYMVEKVRELISIGQTQTLLIFHSKQRFNDLKALIMTYPTLGYSNSVFTSKPNDMCCKGSDCESEDDSFCSKALMGGCSAASDEC